MSLSIDNFYRWWTDNEGWGVELERVLPFVTANKLPLLDDRHTEVIMAGPCSLQAEVAGSTDPVVLRHAFIHSVADRGASVLAAHRHVLEICAPLKSREVVMGRRPDGIEFFEQYDRMIAPVQMISGASLMLTLSRRRPFH